MSNSCVEAVVVTFNSESYIRGCIDSLHKNVTRVMVVDNGSSDETLNILGREYPQIQVVINSSNGYARALNIGLTRTNSDFVVFSNADVIFPESSIEILIRYLQENPQAGVVGPQQVSANDDWQKSYGIPPGPLEGIYDLIGITTLHSQLRRKLWPRKIDRRPKHARYLYGAVLVVRRSTAQSIGGFDETFSFYAEEVDFCVRLRQNGWQVRLVPEAHVIHFGGGSSTKVEPAPDKYLLLLVKAKIRLCFQMRGHGRTALYGLLERIHCSKMSVVYGIASKIFTARRSYFLGRREEFRKLTRIWKQELKSIRNGGFMSAQGDTAKP